MKALLLIGYCSFLFCMQQDDTFPKSEFLKFKSVCSETAHGLYKAHQESSIDQKLAALGVLDQQVQQQSPVLASAVYKQALLLFSSIYCGDLSAIDNLWYAYVSDGALCQPNSVPHKMFSPKKTHSIKIHNECISQKQLYEPFESTQIKIGYAQLLVVSLWNNINAFQDITIKDTELNLLAFYCSTSLEHLNQMHALIEYAFLLCYPHAADATLEQRSEMTQQFFYDYPAYQQLYGVVSSQNIRFKDFLWHYDTSQKKANNVVSALQEILAIVEHPSFLCLSNTLQMLLALYLYDSRVTLPSSIYDEQKASECRKRMKNFYAQLPRDRKTSISNIIQSELEGICLTTLLNNKSEK